MLCPVCAHSTTAISSTAIAFPVNSVDNQRVTAAGYAPAGRNRHGATQMTGQMSHPFGEIVWQHLVRKRGLSQSKLAMGINQDRAVITRMCNGKALTGPQSRERVVAIVEWLYKQDVLGSLEEANAILA